MNTQFQNQQSPQMYKYEEQCRKKLPKDVMDYFAGGSDDENALRRNHTALNLYYGVPRVLIDVSTINLSTTILGNKMCLPYGFAPIAMQKLVHPQGQTLTARAAFARQMALCISSFSSTPLRQIAIANPSGLKILQVYFFSDKEVMLRLLDLAKECGFTALAVTVDTSVFGKRRADLRNNFRPNVTLEVVREVGLRLQFYAEKGKKSAVSALNPNLSWEDIIWLRKNTAMKIILKGVMSVNDAVLAHHHGVDALWISNHGGRQLDSSPPAIVLIPSLRKVLKNVGSNMELYVDGGIKRGTDIFKCLALGANYVFLGRTYLYSLIEGQTSLNATLDQLNEELTSVMRLSGTPSISHILPSFVQFKSNL